MNNIVLSGLVKRRDEDQRLSVRHAPSSHTAYCVPVRTKIYLRGAVARSRQFLTPSHRTPNRVADGRITSITSSSTSHRIASIIDGRRCFLLNVRYAHSDQVPQRTEMTRMGR